MTILLTMIMNCWHAMCWPWLLFQSLRRIDLIIQEGKREEAREVIIALARARVKIFQRGLAHDQVPATEERVCGFALTAARNYISVVSRRGTVKQLRDVQLLTEEGVHAIFLQEFRAGLLDQSGGPIADQQQKGI